MKNALLKSAIFALAFQASAFAQQATPNVVTAPVPFTDPNPYQTQTWYRLSNGMIKTFSAPPSTDAYQFEHPNALPQEVLAAGSNFGIFKGKAGLLIGIVDALGRFYQYDKVPEPAEVGGVYFVKKADRNLVVIDSDGAMMETTIQAPALRMAGGNYFIDQAGNLTTIKSMGMAKWNWAGMVISKAGLKVPTAILAGGNYFVDADGKITTVASTSGFFSDPLALPDSDSVKVYGGTYLITAQLKLYTINEDGALNFVRKLKELPVVRGYSYLVFKDNTFLVQKGDGSVFDRVINTAMSGKPTYQSTIEGSQIVPSSVSKIGGVK